MKTVVSTVSATRSERGDTRPVKLRPLSWLAVVGFMLAHVPLVLLMKQVPTVATLHALLALAVGIRWASTGRELPKVAYIVAYIAGCEVIWRAVGASVFWEFGKYACVLVMVAGLVRVGRYRLPPLPTIYFLLLVPATILTVLRTNLSDAKGLISFNMSGPLALAVAVIFFMQLRVTRRQLLRTLVAFLAPVVGMVSLIVVSLVTADVKFGRQSNPLASGGFGANQVSALLGMACVVAFLCLLDDQVRWQLKLVFGALILEFAAQSALTFSRAGLYYTGVSLTVGSLMLMRNIRTALRLTGMLAVLFLLAYYIVYPQVDEYTGGKLSARFGNTHLSGRAEIMDADLKILQENPVFGVGVGRATEERAKFFKGFAAHTEFTRLFSEHGSFGIVALALLVAMAIRNVLVARTSRGRTVAAALAAYSFCFMTGNGMRMMLPAFAFGLAAVTLVTERRAVNRPAALPPRVARFRQLLRQTPTAPAQ